MGRAPCCPKDAEVKRGAWTPQEDSILTEYIRLHGDGGWKSLPQKAGLKRCGKSCRLRWLNYLRPHINRGNFSEDEDELIIRLHGLLGNRWSLIAGRLPGRTDNQIKNYWNTRLCKKLPRKTETLKSCQENRNNLEVIPVKTTAVRVEKDFMIDMKDSNMNMMSSLHDLLMDESTTHHDLQFVDYSFVDNKNSPLQMINGQISSSDSLGLLHSPDCNLFSPMDFSTMDIRVEESPMNVMKEDHDEFESNVGQQWSFTVCDDQGMEEIYNGFLMGEF